MMKQPLNGLWGGGAALRAGSRVPDLSLELRDLQVARAAMRSAAAAEHGDTGRGDEEAHISAPPDGLTRRIRVESYGYQTAMDSHVDLLAAPKGWHGGHAQRRLQIAWNYSQRSAERPSTDTTQQTARSAGTSGTIAQGED